MKNFTVTGLAECIAPNHLQVIKEIGNLLFSAMDINDSVGLLDKYFLDSNFFTEYDRFDRHLEKLKRNNTGIKIDYFSICTPNLLHDASNQSNIKNWC